MIDSKCCCKSSNFSGRAKSVTPSAMFNSYLFYRARKNERQSEPNWNSNSEWKYARNVAKHFAHRDNVSSNSPHWYTVIIIRNISVTSIVTYTRIHCGLSTGSLKRGQYPWILSRVSITDGSKMMMKLRFIFTLGLIRMLVTNWSQRYCIYCLQDLSIFILIIKKKNYACNVTV